MYVHTSKVIGQMLTNFKRDPSHKNDDNKIVEIISPVIILNMIYHLNQRNI